MITLMSVNAAGSSGLMSPPLMGRRVSALKSPANFSALLP